MLIPYGSRLPSNHDADVFLSMLFYIYRCSPHIFKWYCAFGIGRHQLSYFLSTSLQVINISGTSHHPPRGNL